MANFKAWFAKAYWTFAVLGMIWAVFIGTLISPTVQRQYVYFFVFNMVFFLSISRSLPPSLRAYL